MVKNKVVEYNDETSCAKITVTLDKKLVSSRYKELCDEYLGEMQMPGFRKGKVPLELFEKKHGAALEAETLNKLVEASLPLVYDGMERKPLTYKPADMVEEVAFATDKDLVFVLSVEVEPTFVLPDYKKISVPRYTIEVKKSDVEAELVRLQEQNAFVVTKDSAVASGDIVDVNYSELDETGKELPASRRENFVFTVGEGQNLYSIDDDVMGMKAGESKNISKTYALDYKHAELADRTVALQVKINSVKERKLPALDDEFAQDVSEKFADLIALKADIKEKLLENATKSARNRRINEIVEALVGQITVVLPESMVMADVDARWQQTVRQMGMRPEDAAQFLATNGQSLLESWRGESELAVKRRLVLERIAAQQNFVITPEEIEAEKATMSAQYGMSADQLQASLGEEQFTLYIEEQVKENKLIDLLFDKAKVSEERTLSMEEFAKSSRSAEIGNEG